MNTTVELSEANARLLDRLAAERQQSPADVVGEALRALEPSVPRRFELIGCVEGDGTAFVDSDEDDELEGFGE